MILDTLEKVGSSDISYARILEIELEIVEISLLDECLRNHLEPLVLDADLFEGDLYVGDRLVFRENLGEQVLDSSLERILTDQESHVRQNPQIGDR